MNKYKYSRKEISEEFDRFINRWCDMKWDKKTTDHFLILQDELLSTKEPESDKDKCDHDHLCCPGDIKTVRCAYCGKSMYHEPQEELEVEPIKRLKSYKDKRGNIWIKDTGARKKLNSLIKAHNALVKEVKAK